MKIISDINHQTLPPSVATIGFFDGVHRGHRFLINQVKEVAAKDGLYSALITFPVHPRQVIQTRLSSAITFFTNRETRIIGNDASRLLLSSPFYTGTFTVFGSRVYAVAT